MTSDFSSIFEILTHDNVSFFRPHPHVSKVTSGLKQKCTQLLTRFTVAVLHTRMGEIYNFFHGRSLFTSIWLKKTTELKDTVDYFEISDWPF